MTAEATWEILCCGSVLDLPSQLSVRQVQPGTPALLPTHLRTPARCGPLAPRGRPLAGRGPGKKHRLHLKWFVLFSFYLQFSETEQNNFFVHLQA